MKFTTFIKISDTWVIVKHPKLVKKNPEEWTVQPNHKFVCDYLGIATKNKR
jgi:hypothetical protein